ncbi:MAG TPA: aldolase/citrate lyase family protein [Azospirillum sp.]|nr:aldolase/citrate lyase family protein [Azospirillum sp.]
MHTTRRSWLFTPATMPERFERAASTGADVLILDLEDAVAPDRKEEARRIAVEFLSKPSGWQRTARAVRINSPTTPYGLEDLLALIRSEAKPDAVIVPKVDSAEIIRLIDGLLVDGGRAAPLVPLVESARGVAAAKAIAGASPRVEALFFGAADLAADLGAEVAWEPLLSARSRVVNAAAMARVGVIDSPFFDLHDDAGLQEETQRAVRLGFTSKAAIHPKQVATINAALTPSAEAVAEARRILEENTKGVGVVGGRMVDEAVARKARRTLAAAGELKQ